MSNEALWRHRVWLLKPLASAAPERPTTSAAMQEVREAIARRDAEARAASAEYERFLQERAEVERARDGAERLARDVAAFGSDAVEHLRGRLEPGFTLPEHLRNIPAPLRTTEPKTVESEKAT
jgi:hypothetical protein